MLDPLDRALDRPGRVLVRYVDDLLAVCQDERTARRVLETMRGQLAPLGLALNDAKTVIQPYDAGFSFLGLTLPQLPPIEPRGAAVRALAEAFRTSGYWRMRHATRANPPDGRPRGRPDRAADRLPSGRQLPDRRGQSPRITDSRRPL